MKYNLRAESSPQNLASAELADNFAAENWAKDWVKAHAELDVYILQSGDGRFAMRVFRTKAGQWYLTPLAMASA